MSAACVNKKIKRSLIAADFTFPSAWFLKKHNSLRSNSAFFTKPSPGNVENPAQIRSLIYFFIFQCFLF